MEKQPPFGSGLRATSTNVRVRVLGVFATGKYHAGILFFWIFRRYSALDIRYGGSVSFAGRLLYQQLPEHADERKYALRQLQHS